MAADLEPTDNRPRYPARARRRRRRGQPPVARTRLPWERMATESPQAFQAFARYRDMRQRRSQHAVARELRKSASLIARWSATNDWIKRVELFDWQEDRETRLVHQEAIREMNERHIKLAQQAQDLVAARLESLDPSKMSPHAAAHWLEIATKLERLAYGEDTERVAVGGTGVPIGLEMSLDVEVHVDDGELARLEAISGFLAEAGALDAEPEPVDGTLVYDDPEAGDPGGRDPAAEDYAAGATPRAAPGSDAEADAVHPAGAD